MTADAGLSADVVLWLKRDVFWASLENSLLVHNPTGGFEITSASAYDFADQLLPRLDGTRTVGELRAGLSPSDLRKFEVLVGELVRRDFARAVDPDADRAADLDPVVRRVFAAQIEYVRHHRDGAAAAFAAFRGLRIGVLGADPTAQWAAIGLIRNGAGHVVVDDRLLHRPATGLPAPGAAAQVKAAEGAPVALTSWPGEVRGWADAADVDIVLAGPSATPSVLELSRSTAATGAAQHALLAAVRLGEHVVVGPYRTPGSRGCAICLALRYGANADPAAAAAFWSSTFLRGEPETAGDIAAPQHAMIGNLLAFEAFRAATGMLAPDTDGRVMIQHLATGDVRAAQLAPHPRCPACYDPKAPAEQAEVASLAAALHLGAPLAPVLDDQDEAGTALYERRSAALVDRHVGVVTAFDDEYLLQTPVKNTRVVFGLGHLDREGILVSHAHSVLRARLAALDEALRRYVDRTVPLLTVPDDGRRRIAGRELSTWTGLDGGSEPEDRWAVAHALLTDDTALLPAAVVAPFGVDNTRGRFERCSCGTGVGADPAAALADGLDSALAHHALSALAAGRVSACELDERGGSPELIFLRAAAAIADAPVELFELTGDVAGPRPVVFARCAEDWSARAAADLDTAAALAACDVLGRWQAAHDDEPPAPPGSGHGPASRPAGVDDPVGQCAALRTGFDPAIVIGAPARAARTTADAADQRAVFAAAGISEVLVVPRPSPELASADLVAVRVLLAGRD